MLAELSIKDFGVIAAAAIEFSPGFTALTGETGAGKTMVVSGLNQLLGARADPAIVRRGASRAVVEGRWLPDQATALAAGELGAELDDGELLTSRIIGAGGRSRALVGGVQTTLAAMAGLLEPTAAVFGQSEQARLTWSDRPREMLDAHAGQDELGDYEREHAARKASAKELARLRAEALERAREIDMLAFGLDEIAEVDPAPGEDEALTAEFIRLRADDELRALAGAAQAALSGGDDPIAEPGAVGLIGAAAKAMRQAGERDASAQSLVERVGELGSRLNDLACDVSGYLADLEADPARLDAIASRRAQLARLTRKYGRDVDEVLAWASEASARLELLRGGDERADALAAQIDALSESLTARAARITARREAVAEELAEACSAELAALAMPAARLRFEVSPLGELGPHGGDKVELWFAADPGAEPGPLSRVASGGELSRVRLALEVVLSRGATGRTLVFDEVDAGVGGAVGLEIGRRLKLISRDSQVIVVTHLAQVAAFADRHFVVSKSADSGAVSSEVCEVSGQTRISELARMMGGMDSQAALAHARDLLAEADRRTDP